MIPKDPYVLSERPVAPICSIEADCLKAWRVNLIDALPQIVDSCLRFILSKADFDIPGYS